MIKSEIDEIKVTPNYTHLLVSSCDEESEGKTTPVIKRKTVFTDDYLPRLSSTYERMLPPNCRYIKQTSRGYIVIIEESPSYRTVKFNSSYPIHSRLAELAKLNKVEKYGYKNYLETHSQPYHFNIALPYVVFFLLISNNNTVDGGKVFLRTNQMIGLSDYLLLAPFPNISDGGYICFGSDVKGQQKSLYSATQHAIMVWWSAIFNSDYMYNVRSYENIPIINNIFEWEYFSQKDPMFIYNINWVPTSDTIQGTISRMMRSYGEDSEKLSYDKLKTLFVSPYKKEMNKKELVYDIAQGTYLGNNFYITCGDYFQTKNGKLVFIDTFIGKGASGSIEYIQIDIEGKKQLLKFHRECREFLEISIQKYRNIDQLVLPNGQTIKKGDLIKFSDGDRYSNVQYIRKSRGFEETAIVEVKIGSEIYFSSYLPTVTVINTDSIKVSGITLLHDKEYYVTPTSSNVFDRIQPLMKSKFQQFSSSGEYEFSAKFVNDEFGVINIPVKEEQRRRVYEIEEFTQLQTDYIRKGRKLIRPIDNGKFIFHKATEKYFAETTTTRPLVKFSDIESLVNENKTELFIKGIDFDIHFSVGDMVVAATWADPLEVLKLKIIKNFEVTSENIYFILVDKNGQESRVHYVSAYSGEVYVGRIRKATNIIDDNWRIGTKIQATKAGIYGFPKKDINIITAFITDTYTEPLVLCSNGLTLWLSDVDSNFKKIKMTDKKWSTLNHVPLILDKIKFQAGDIIRSPIKEDGGYLVNTPTPTRMYRLIKLNNISDSLGNDMLLDSYIEQSYLLDCIPPPRVNKIKIEPSMVEYGHFNLHSFDVDTSFKSPLTFLKQRR